MDLVRLRAISISALMLLLMFANLFIQNPSAAVAPEDRVKNPGFEIVTASVYDLEDWGILGGGHRALLGDITSDKQVDMADVSLVAAAFGATPESPNWNTQTNPQGPDLNGDGRVDMRDVAMVSVEFGKSMGVDAFCLDGSYSWYANGGSSVYPYFLRQDLDNDVAETLRGRNVVFSFWFYPDCDAIVRAGIEYYQGVARVSAWGDWVSPVQNEWNRVEVITSLPEDATGIVLLVESGVPAQHFAGWIDKAELRMRFATMEATDDYPWAFHRAWKDIHPHGYTQLHVQCYAYIEDYEVTGQDVHWYCRCLDEMFYPVWCSNIPIDQTIYYTGPGYYLLDFCRNMTSGEWESIAWYTLDLYCGAYITGPTPTDECPYVPWY